MGATETSTPGAHFSCQMKVCSKCYQEFPEDNFYSHSAPRKGRYPWCRKCHQAGDRKRAAARIEALSSLTVDELLRKNLYYRTLGLSQRGLKYCKRCNKVKPRDDFYPTRTAKKMGSRCKECQSKLGKIYRDSNPESEKATAARKKLRLKTDPEYLEHKRRWAREYHKRPRPRFIKNLRCHTKILKDIGKPESTSTLLGGNAKDIIAHLTNGSDRIPKGYDIDHHVPLAFFNLENDFQRLVCFNWRNLRLLTVTENRTKRGKAPEDLESHLTAICAVLGFPPKEVLRGRN